MPPPPPHQLATIMTGTPPPPPRDIDFGLYDLRRPATSPTRKGGRGRPAPRLPPLRGSGGAAIGPTRRPGAAVPTAAATTTASCRAELSSATTVGVPAAPTHATCDNSGISGAASPSPHGSSRQLEMRLQWVLHPVGAASTLPAPLQRILGDALRLLHQERAQRKGQRPWRRQPLPSPGTDMSADVACSLAEAAQAASPAAAADVLRGCLAAHPMDPTTFASSPAVMVGAALAELVALDHAPSCHTAAPQLLHYLDAAAGIGHPGAMHAIAVCLRDGVAGLECDAAASRTWLRCAAVAGYLPAVHELGEACERGASSSPEPDDGHSEDWGDAMRWYRVAAEAGHTPSQLNLGKLLLSAAGHAQRDGSASAAQVAYLLAEATRWLHACASAGVEEAVRLVRHIEAPGAVR
ncbi:hypothetical protein NESM_000599000 [Novymonas esmeraldas]|uniref:Sel1 repeat family protein n=1 Tax=Novymonas esmeraldas TaxID=1808958 RepID=A0AAW0ESA0_9TRYP